MNKLKIKHLIVTLFLSAFFNLYAQEATVNIDQPEAINKLLEYKKDIKTVEIYKIQVFQSNNPNKAQSAKTRFKQKYNQWPVSLEFNTPNYKVWVGKFRDRLEADRALLILKKDYMNAFIFQPKK